MTAWSISTFSTPLKDQSIRTTLIIRTQNANGVRFAEVAPLPGRSQESMQDALHQLIDHFNQRRQEHLLPSVQFGLESLYQEPTYPLTFFSYALLLGTPTQILSRAAHARAQGHHTVKCKVGHLSLEEAQAVIRALQPYFRLRIDCNCAFSASDAQRLFDPFDPSDFDYIEDPSYEVENLSSFIYPVALDETCVSFLPCLLNPYGFVLKPSVQGGKKGCLPLLKMAAEKKLQVVLSSAFESRLGLAQIATLAHSLGLEKTLLGIDTHALMQEDLLADLPWHLPQITLKEAPRVHTAFLKEIAHGVTN